MSHGAVGTFGMKSLEYELDRCLLLGMTLFLLICASLIIHYLAWLRTPIQKVTDLRIVLGVSSLSLSSGWVVSCVLRLGKGLWSAEVCLSGIREMGRSWNRSPCSLQVTTTWSMQ